MIDKKIINAYYHAHKEAYEKWEHGIPEKAWIDEEILCIQYTDGAWYHYRSGKDGAEWW